MNRWAVAGVGLAIVGIAGSTALLITQTIGEGSFVILAISSILTGFGTTGFERLRELDLRNLRVTLDAIQKAREDVFATQEELREASTRLARLIAVTTALQGVLGNAESHQALRLMVEQRTRELLEGLAVSGAVADEMFKYQRALERMRGVEDEVERTRLWSELVCELRSDAQVK